MLTVLEKKERKERKERKKTVFEAESAPCCGICQCVGHHEVIFPSALSDNHFLLTWPVPIC